jgi:hypothetical protein
VRLFHFLWLFYLCVPPRAYSQNSEPLLIVGKDGFNFYLIRDGTGQPVKSIEGFPLYEGKNGKYRVTSSSHSLAIHRHLPELGVPSLDSEWIPDFARIKVPISAVSGLLQYFQKNPEDFIHFFKGMTSTKAEIFRSLLFDQVLVLTSEDIRSLQRNSLNSNPSAIKIPIVIDNSASPSGKLIDLFAQMISDIQGSEFRFTFKNKHIEFDSTAGLAKLELTVEKAELRGPVHQMGRVKGLWQYRDRGELRRIPLNVHLGSVHIHNLAELLYFYDSEDILIKGEVGEMVLGVELTFAQDVSGLWEVKLVKPLSLKLLDPDPHVAMSLLRKADGGGYKKLDDSPRLSEKVRIQIENTLSDTLKQALSTYFFPNDLGFQVPLQAPAYENFKEDVNLETKLSRVEFLRDGMLIGFDGRLSMQSPAACVPSAEELVKNLKAPPRQEYLNSEPGNVWVLDSTFPSEKDPTIAPQPLWHSDNDGSVLPLEVQTPREAIELVNLGAYAAGLYCLSSRAWWPRPGYIPLIEFRPSEPPRLSLNESQIRAAFSGSILTYNRNRKPVGESFELDSRGQYGIRFEVPTVHLREAFAFQIQNPEKIELYDVQNVNRNSFSPEENDFVADLFSGIFGGPSESKLRFTFADLERLFRNQIQLKSVHLTASGADVLVDPGEFKWVASRPEPAKLSSEENLQTEFLSDRPSRISDSFLRLRWRQHSPEVRDVFYSWSLKSDGVWSDWSPFDSDQEVLKSLSQTGKYEFQVKAMNRKFEIEEIPQSYEFYYEAPVNEPTKVVKSSDWAKPVKIEKKAADLKTERYESKEADKGAFGCSLNVPSENFVQSMWCLILALLALGFLRVSHRRCQQ